MPTASCAVSLEEDRSTVTVTSGGPFTEAARTTVAAERRLFDGRGSGWSALTLTRFTARPSAFASATSVTAAVRPALSRPREHLMAADPEHLPWEAFAETRTTCAAISSSRTTEVACAGPLFRT